MTTKGVDVAKALTTAALSPAFNSSDNVTVLSIKCQTSPNPAESSNGSRSNDGDAATSNSSYKPINN